MIFNSKFLKIISLFLVILFSFQFLYVFADDVDFTLNARSAIILDRTSKKILYGKNEYRKVKMASTTKIMTAIVILENCDLSQTVQVSKKAAGTGGSRLGLKANDKITINDLLYGLLLCSGNDAAVCLAEVCSGSVKDFSNLMNLKAEELGLKNSHFETPHGLDSDEHYTTAYELALLADYALENSTFRKIVGTKTYTVTINGYPKNLSNTNELLGNLNGVYGVKTGFTNGANRCLVTACKRDNMDIICVVLGCDTKKFRTTDSVKLIEYAFKNYEYVNIKNIIDEKFLSWKEENLNNVNIVKGINSNLSIRYSDLENPILPIKKEEISSLEVNFKLNSYLEAPINKDDKIGMLSVMSNGIPIVECDILADCEIKRKNVLFYLYELFKDIECIESIL